jgi:hypothetical protein
MVSRTAAGLAAAIGLSERPRSSAPAGPTNGRPERNQGLCSTISNDAPGPRLRDHRTREAGRPTGCGRGRGPATRLEGKTLMVLLRFGPHVQSAAGRRTSRPAHRSPSQSPDSLANQEIEKEGLPRRWGRRRRRRGGRARRALGSRRRQRTVVFFAQGGARRISRRGAGPGGRRRVERTLPTASCEPQRCGHDGHQGEPH